MNLVAMIQVYNEVANGNLERCLDSISRYCDAIQVYDDGSTDNPKPLYEKYKCDIIWGSDNDFKNELAHKQAQLDRCRAIGADWIFRVDADEVVEKAGEDGGVRALCETSEHDSWAFHMVNMWRSTSYYRLDLGYNDVVFNRLWRVPPKGLRFNVQTGLHLVNYPIGATDNEGFTDLQILHYGFASDDAVVAKYRMYKAHGQSGWALQRLIDETTLTVRPTKASWFRDGLERQSRNQVYKVPIAHMV